MGLEPGAPVGGGVPDPPVGVAVAGDPDAVAVPDAAGDPDVPGDRDAAGDFEALTPIPIAALPSL
jgi:hypothetical protein